MAVVRLYLGKISPEACLAAASLEDERLNLEQQCEAHYYIAVYYEREGQRRKALSHFEKCQATGVDTFVEYHAALSERDRIGR
ncbi:MAG: hypothetical protein HQL31_03830 [Planctomycetes bacterium]|nr:hypothetical protein [Planctomycetota bacterium]